MKDVSRAKWIANFEMEPLISQILKSGMILSIVLLFLGIILTWFSGAKNNFGPNLHAKSIPQLIWLDLRQLHHPEFGPNLHAKGISELIRLDLQQFHHSEIWPRFLIHLAFSILLMTPYVRIFISLLYFAFIENNWKYVGFSTLTLIILTVALFTTLV